MIAKAYRQFLSTTAVAAILGAMLATVYIATNQLEHTFWLVIAQFIGVACIVSLLFNMLLIISPAIARYIWESIINLMLPYGYSHEEGPDWDLIRMRRKKIDERINAAEAYYCAFCAENNCEEHGFSSASLASITNQNTNVHQSISNRAENQTPIKGQ